jgi:hypothetical protein
MRPGVALAHRGNVFIQNRSSGLSGLRLDEVISFRIRIAVYRVERDGGGGNIAAMMAGPARYHLHAGEVGLVDGAHHLDHLAAVFFAC